MIFNKKKSFTVAIFVALFLAIMTGNLKLFYVSLTGSLSRGIYMAIPTFGRYRQGDIVVYEPTDEVKGFVEIRHYGTGNGELFMKKIGALPGDFYSVSTLDNSFRINNEYVGTAAKTDSEGRELPVQTGVHYVEKDCFLPVSFHSLRSFDGRYTGTVPMANIKSRVVPLLVEW